ncbi:hypothetical protein [Pelagicoccus sp. SDUM812005]|uniref:hypothetical protein n=1 Tax=Pelagicoccus sp. SDUM812005 TaxID=3041257 RepID=UPI00280D4083|nr:hypothetical protein [Pelagicoccus sp. SDUM812005]MDQ8180223.1 hypothetical protein [Pelagicoccus sp. SDUM812005]
MDPEVRKLAKTRPWEGIVVSLGLAILLGHSLATGSIRFGNSRYREPVVMRYEEQPVDFIIVMGIVATILAGAVAYTIFRFRKRAKFRREDGDSG